MHLHIIQAEIERRDRAERHMLSVIAEEVARREAVAGRIGEAIAAARRSRALAIP